MWLKPQFIGEPITGYVATAMDPLGKKTRCRPSNTNDDSFGFTFENLLPCMSYDISVRACGHENGHSVGAKEVGWTEPDDDACFSQHWCKFTRWFGLWILPKWVILHEPHISSISDSNMENDYKRGQIWLKFKDYIFLFQIIDDSRCLSQILYAIICVKTWIDGQLINVGSFLW